MNTTTKTLSPTLVAATSSQPSSRGNFYQRIVMRQLQCLRRGRLEVHLPGGGIAIVGEEAAAASRLPLGISGVAKLEIKTPLFFQKCVLSGDIGFAEAYLDGEWDTPDLPAVIAFFILNLEDAPTLSGSKRRAIAVNWLRALERVRFWLRPNSRSMAKRNISEHYDLSNELFSLFLDPTLMYSSGKWAHPEQTLHEAQNEKNEALCRSLRLKWTDHVLEIGTGWGGWSLNAARNYGCRVTTVTISREQFELARRRVAEAGLSDRVDVRFCDYREITGSYDKLVSIEMLEAVGHAFQPDFARVCARVLKKDGLMALQFITCPDHRYAAFRRGVDFIQKHVFPGSLLLSLNRLNELFSHSGGFVLHEMTNLGHDYARTLRCWRETFRQRLPEVRELGFDERFIRKWDYYLAYCEAAFAMRNISVVQTLHTRPNNLSL